MPSQSVWLAFFSSLVILSLSVAADNEGVDTIVPSPTTTFQATRGLSQTVSAEPLGAGRLTFSMLGTWYGQKIGFQNTPGQSTDVLTGTTAFSFGVNTYIDMFGSIAGWGLSRGTSEFGLGSVCGGIEGSLPLPRESPLRIGAQMAIIGGTSSNQINGNNADGYNYFETRTGYDFLGKIMETVLFGNEARGLKIHFNQGGVMSLETGREKLLLLGAGLEGLVHPILVLGMEINSRTQLKNIDIKTDPLWLTPSMQIRTPYFFNVVFGSDISLSEDRAGPALRALEPYRIFGGLVFSFDLLFTKRRAMAEKAKQDAAEKAAITKKAKEAQDRADSLARKVREDSLAMAKAQEAERQRADSLAKKAIQDSIQLAETKKKLDEERYRRTDAEKQLLSTGMLLLDAVYFETGKAEISINSYPYLNIIAKMLTKYPKLQIEVAGHTDNVGKFQSNMILSQARANAVKLYLMQVAPELSGNLTSQGYGPTQPKALNTSAQGRKLNRRTELVVKNKDVLKEYNPWVCFPDSE